MKKKTFKSVFGLQKGVSFLVFMLFLGWLPSAMAATAEINADTLIYITCKGLVIDEISGMPLSYASVLVEGTNMASVTNSEGEFVLNVPKYLKNNNLLVTYIGYQNERIQVSLFDGVVRRIPLKIAEVSLSEVRVTFKDAQELMKNVFDLKKENYV